MKYLISLVVGMAAGVAAFVALLYYNPMMSQNRLSPLSVTDNDVITFNYSTVATDALVFTNDGESTVAPYPSKVQQLWEPTVRLTDTTATVLRDSRNEPVALGIKFSSRSESTRIFNGEAIIDSAWHIYVPGQGSLFVEQRENYWDYLREIVIPAHRSSGDNWRGNWSGTITSGPGVLGTARVFGGSGEFADLETIGAESLSAKAYSAKHGPVAVDGKLAVELPVSIPDATPNP